MNWISRTKGRLLYATLVLAAFVVHTCAVEADSQAESPRIPARYT